ncbi:MAG: S-formylglutathione hydrolase [Pseudomonadota bacterium]|nr:S-formylglutathione hydrolase [Pseudomonadota bacterium]
MTLKPVSSWTSFGGEMAVFDHDSAVCGCEMRFAVFTPSQAKDGPVPVLWYLSGLTCNWSNVMEKSGLQRVAAALGLMVIAPDTSPRGADVPDDDGYDLGQGAGFYLSATQAPWSQHFHMDRYITEELSILIEKSFAADMSRQGITGHSMGGHGALTLHLKNPKQFRSVSAFSPIVAPMDVPWGQKALSTYLGDQKSDWEKHDSCVLVRKQPSRAHILVDQGLGDQFLDQQLRPDLFETACAEAGQDLTLRRHEGYDHSYYFIASFIEDHLRHHAAALNSL